MRRNFILEIQGLRAVAVLLVLAYHIQPSLVSGGYIGVDVFFVISGFIITKLLFEEVKSNNNVQLLRFFSRRIFRLLPSALIVLIFVALLLPLIPMANWDVTAYQLVASVFYVQNWYMAWGAIDYLGGDVYESPLKHFWTLSVEEQFYIFWPLIMALVAFVTYRFKRSYFVTIIFVTLALILASACYSYWYTQYNPNSAYFSTLTRAWQFLLGAACAVLIAEKQWTINKIAAQGLCAVGLVLIAYSAFSFSGSTIFPGVSAWVPSLGAVFVLFSAAARSAHSELGVFSALLANSAAVFIGRISYSLYLWHWPIIFLCFSLFKVDITLLSALAVSLLSILISSLTTLFFEEPLRKWGTHASRPRSVAFSVPLISFTLVTMIAFSSIVIVYGKQPGMIRETNIQQKSLPDFDSSVKIDDLVPHPLAARQDNPVIYGRKCHQNQNGVEPEFCDFGNENASKLIVLSGDSHAASFMPALERLVQRNNEYRLRVVTKSSCSLTTTKRGSYEKEYTSCTEWNKRLLERLISWKPDMVITTQMQRGSAYGAKNGADNTRLITDGLVSLWKMLQENGIRVVAVADVPRHSVDIPECLTAPGASLESCSSKRDDVFVHPDILENAAAMAGATFLDFSHVFCDDVKCPPNRGRLLMWRDRHHLTQTFSSLLSQQFADALDIPQAEMDASQVSAAASRESLLVGTLTCSALRDGKPRSFNRRVHVNDGKISFHRGNYESFYDEAIKARRIPKVLARNGTEVWHGIINEDNEIKMIGWYTEGSRDTKWITMEGQIDDDGHVYLQGVRGPRSCEFTGQVLR